MGNMSNMPPFIHQMHSSTESSNNDSNDDKSVTTASSNNGPDYHECQHCNKKFKHKILMYLWVTPRVLWHALIGDEVVIEVEKDEK